MSKKAPIVVFAFNRADRLECLLRSLEQNPNTETMDLYIFVDVPDEKDKQNIKNNQEVIEFISRYREGDHSFRNIKVEIAKEHKGLAESIISGVTKVINRYGKVIVLEDDLEVSNDFLDYMQRGLEFYSKNSKVWSITAHCPALKSLNKYKADVFFGLRSESLGWGTWKNRWSHMDWKVPSYENFKRDFVGQALFNLGGNNLCETLRLQMTDPQFDSWAIRWCYQQFRERKYTVCPKESRVIHCGNDSRSTHGVYYSTQCLKDEYSRCEFCDLKPDYRVIWELRSVNNYSFIKWVCSRLKARICNLKSCFVRC